MVTAVPDGVEAEQKVKRLLIDQLAPSLEQRIAACFNADADNRSAIRKLVMRSINVGWRRMRARARPSSTIAAAARSLSTRSSGLFYRDGVFEEVHIGRISIFVEG